MRNKTIKPSSIESLRKSITKNIMNKTSFEMCGELIARSVLDQVQSLYEENEQKEFWKGFKRTICDSKVLE